MLQVEIPGQHGLDIGVIPILVDGTIQLDDAAELVATAVACIVQPELGVLLRVHAGKNTYRTVGVL